MELLQRKKKNNAFIIDSKMSNLSKKKKKNPRSKQVFKYFKIKKTFSKTIISGDI